MKFKHREKKGKNGKNMIIKGRKNNAQKKKCK